MKVIFQLWMHDTYFGYRTVSKQFWENLNRSLKTGMLKKADIQVLFVKELSD